MNEDFSKTIIKSKTDEWYSPENVVEMIVPYLISNNFKNIWCPFDTEKSNFVKVLHKHGFNVTHSHIQEGKDFFDQDLPKEIDCIVSNPPFSKRDSIIQKLYSHNKPFAMVINFNGLFDNRKRFEMFSKNGIQLLIPKGRMKFFQEDGLIKNSPNIQSIYVCYKVLNHSLEFSSSEF